MGNKTNKEELSKGIDSLISPSLPEGKKKAVFTSVETEAKKSFININISNVLKKRLQMYCVLEGISMKDYLIQIIEEDLKKKGQ